MTTKRATEPREGTLQAKALALFRKGGSVPIERLMRAIDRNEEQARGMITVLKRRHGWRITNYPRRSRCFRLER